MEVLQMIKDERINKIIEISKKHKITPTMMSRMIGISIPTYYRYRKGETSPETQSIIRSIENIIQQYGG